MNHYNYFTNKAYTKKNLDILNEAVKKNNFIAGNKEGIHFWMTFAQIAKNKDHFIIKGSKGIKIVVPVGKDINDNLIFKSTYVFHISQTEKKVKDSKMKKVKRDRLKKLFS